MDPSMLVELIGSLGFPIVCCGALFWYQAKTLESFTKGVSDSLKDLASTINNNTQATNSLVTTVELLTKVGEGHG